MNADQEAFIIMLERSKREAALKYLQQALDYADNPVKHMFLTEIRGIDYVLVTLEDGTSDCVCVEGDTIPRMICDVARVVESPE